MNEKTEEFYKRLKDELLNTSLWPSIYLYKFVVPTDAEKIERIFSSYDNMGAVIDTKLSKNGKYTSVSVRVRMENPDTVIQKYVELSDIEGLLSL